MKKLLSFVLAIVLVFPNFLSLKVSAAGMDISNQTQLMELAKKTFPEYADKISGENGQRNSALQTTNSMPNVVVQETRCSDSNTNITYVEYDNGLVALGAVRYQPYAHIESDDLESYSSYTLYSATITAYVLEGPTFTATNVQYRLYPSAYDRITSEGNYGIRGYTNDQFTVLRRESETASLPAYVSYSFACLVGGVDCSGKVTFKLSNNTPSVVFDVWV